MISEVNLAQKASSPSAHDKPKKMKKTIVAEKTMDTIVYPRWMWIRRALSRGKYLFNLLLEKAAIVYLLIVKGMSAIWKRTEQKRDVKCWSWTWMSELLRILGRMSTTYTYYNWTYWHASSRTQWAERVFWPSILVPLRVRHSLVAGTWSKRSELKNERPG